MSFSRYIAAQGLHRRQDQLQTCSHLTHQEMKRGTQRSALCYRGNCSVPGSLHTAIEMKIVKLASAILNPGDKIAPCYSLGEIDEIIGDWWSCKYLRPSFDLHFDTNADTTLYLALRSDDEDLDQAETHPLWISMPI